MLTSNQNQTDTQGMQAAEATHHSYPISADTKVRRVLEVVQRLSQNNPSGRISLEAILNQSSYFVDASVVKRILTCFVSVNMLVEPTLGEYRAVNLTEDGLRAFYDKTQPLPAHRRKREEEAIEVIEKLLRGHKSVTKKGLLPFLKDFNENSLGKFIYRLAADNKLIQIGIGVYQKGPVPFDFKKPAGIYTNEKTNENDSFVGHRPLKRAMPTPTTVGSSRPAIQASFPTNNLIQENQSVPLSPLKLRKEKEPIALVLEAVERLCKMNGYASTNQIHQEVANDYFPLTKTGSNRLYATLYKLKNTNIVVQREGERSIYRMPDTKDVLNPSVNGKTLTVHPLPIAETPAQSGSLIDRLKAHSLEVKPKEVVVAVPEPPVVTEFQKHMTDSQLINSIVDKAMDTLKGIIEPSERIAKDLWYVGAKNRDEAVQKEAKHYMAMPGNVQTLVALMQELKSNEKPR